ncbi:MAG: AbrB/MazE/SpoVT family DNA-binding domain-containing protein [Oscillospiraceae bacterium]|nr:AbrB/MazE/SpoVT family DNA-binding domain-containing protein [Oscillospiraceae bacterium]
MAVTAIVSKWGNSSGVRIPIEILKKANIGLNDKLFLEVEKDGCIVMSKIPAPQKGTLEYLFKDYHEKPFQTELPDLGEPVGNEKW